MQGTWCGSLQATSYWSEQHEDGRSIEIHTYMSWQLYEDYKPVHVRKSDFGFRWKHIFLLIPRSARMFFYSYNLRMRKTVVGQKRALADV